MEGTIYHKFDMKPHSENIEDYGRYCRERTNKSMAKPRQTRVSFLLFFLNKEYSSNSKYVAVQSLYM